MNQVLSRQIQCLGAFSSKPAMRGPVERVFILRVVENFADARVGVQQLPLDVGRVDRLHQQLRLQLPWVEDFENLMSYLCDRIESSTVFKVPIFFWLDTCILDGLRQLLWRRPVSPAAGCGFPGPSSRLAAIWTFPSFKLARTWQSVFTWKTQKAHLQSWGSGPEMWGVVQNCQNKLASLEDMHSSKLLRRWPFLLFSCWSSPGLDSLTQLEQTGKSCKEGFHHGCIDNGQS